MAVKAQEQRKKMKKRTPLYYQSVKNKHFGSRRKKTGKYNYFWAIDVPNHFYGEPYLNFFDKKCLITCTALGLLQHEYFQNSINKKFVNIDEGIFNNSKQKQKTAGNILVNEFHSLINDANLPANGPYELETTCEALSNTFKCQFIIFNGLVNSSKLIYMYPPEYNDNLIPIYLFNPSYDSNHFVYIKKLSSFFKRNFRICLCCKKTFRSRISKPPMHNCRSRPTCFACRRFYQSSNTYINSQLKNDFCDKYTTKETPTICDLCNVTVFSTHCYQSHKRFCGYSTGNFGYKCLNCGVFTYRNGSQNSVSLKENHRCKNVKNCTVCYKPIEENESHLCALKKEIISPNNWPRLAFISFEHYVKEDGELVPFLASINREENERGYFSKYVLAANNLQFEINYKEEQSLFFSYLNVNEQKPPQFKQKDKLTLTDDFQINLDNLRKMRNSIDLSLTDKIVHFAIDPQWADTTYIIQDFNSVFLMSLLNSFIFFGFGPNVLRHNGKILLIEIKSLNIRFITSNNYLNGDEYQISKQFNISFDQHFFLAPIYANYVLPNSQCKNNIPFESTLKCNETTCNYKLPCKKLFFTHFDSEEVKKKKTF